MKKTVEKIPLFNYIYKLLIHIFIYGTKPFINSEDYWKRKYKFGGSSGAGSYNKFSEFKAEVLNKFVKEHDITTVIEYGCGDGNQLALSEYPSYFGFDVSADAIAHCKKTFIDDDTKQFKLVEDYSGETAQLTLSLDVIFHLIEDEIFHKYMDRLFDSSTNYVIIYSSNTDQQARLQPAHVKHRVFTDWVEHNKLEWKLIRQISNKYPYVPFMIGKVPIRYPLDDQRGSFSDFYIYMKD